jgi:hypothetical protein
MVVSDDLRMAKGAIAGMEEEEKICSSMTLKDRERSIACFGI